MDLDTDVPMEDVEDQQQTYNSNESAIKSANKANVKETATSDDAKEKRHL